MWWIDKQNTCLIDRTSKHAWKKTSPSWSNFMYPQSVNQVSMGLCGPHDFCAQPHKWVCSKHVSEKTPICPSTAFLLQETSLRPESVQPKSEKSWRSLLPFLTLSVKIRHVAKEKKQPIGVFVGSFLPSVRIESSGGWISMDFINSTARRLNSHFTESGVCQFSPKLHPIQ